MAITEGAKDALDAAIETISSQGHTIWGFILNPDGNELQPFGNFDGGIEVFVHNLEEGAKALRETYQINSEKHEA